MIESPLFLLAPQLLAELIDHFVGRTQTNLPAEKESLAPFTVVGDYHIASKPQIVCTMPYLHHLKSQQGIPWPVGTLL
jgi:hypothetical protein